jgi:uncharacterized protein (DUF924 family)
MTDADSAGTIDRVLDFWFKEAGPEKWFARSAAFDEEVRARFADAHQAAARGRFADMLETPRGCVALCILLDQVPRNIFRDSPRAFGSDAEAREIARHAIESGFDLDPSLSDEMRLFLYTPFEHSETVEDQRLSVSLIGERMDNAEYRKYAERHRNIIERFGRFPHRNVVLGRDTTPEEAAFLNEKGSSF